MWQKDTTEYLSKKTCVKIIKLIVTREMRVAQQIQNRGETVVLNLPETVMLAVYEGKCGCLRPTNRVIAVPKCAISGDDSCWSLQVSKFDDAFWLIYKGWRYRGKCFCTHCNQVFNGDGGNLRKHFASHKDGPKWTREQQERAFFMFLISLIIISG